MPLTEPMKHAQFLEIKMSARGVGQAWLQPLKCIEDTCPNRNDVLRRTH